MTELDRDIGRLQENAQTGQATITPDKLKVLSLQMQQRLAEEPLSFDKRTCGSSRSPSPWTTALLARRPYKIVAVALANKMARIIWALLLRGGTYQDKGAGNQRATA